MSCGRLPGHAGSDAEIAYRSREQIAAAEARDPLLYSARLLIDLGILRPDQIIDLYRDTEERVNREAELATQRPKLNSAAAAVMASMILHKKPLPALPPIPEDQRLALFAREALFMQPPQHLARLLNWARADLMLVHAEILMMGEDIGPKGGAYNVTTSCRWRWTSSVAW